MRRRERPGEHRDLHLQCPTQPGARETQQTACGAFADEIGYEVARTYSDEGGARMALTRLLADATEGAVSILVVSDLARLGRTIATAPRIVETLRGAGVTVYAAAQGRRLVSSNSPELSTLLTAAIYETRGRRPFGRI